MARWDDAVERRVNSASLSAKLWNDERVVALREGCLNNGFVQGVMTLVAS